MDTPGGRAAGLEQEIKARLDDRDALVATLRALGAVVDRPRAFEGNELWDTPSGDLRATGRVLRIRRWGDDSILTVKGPAVIENGLKSRPEEEVRVDDPQRLRHLVELLGYVRVFRYEKFRESWRFDDVEVVLDETPLGNFVEVEGVGEAVRRAFDRLGLPATAIVEFSYANLWRLHREQDPSAGHDMVFPPGVAPA